MFLNSGNGQVEFIEAQTFEDARTMSFADVNLDGKPDLIASGTTEIEEGKTRAFSCPQKRVDQDHEAIPV